jgi:hypothetical protein
MQQCRLNRLEVLAYGVWLMTVAWQAIQVRSQQAQVHG